MGVLRLTTEELNYKEDEEIEVYHCPNCHGNMAFDVETQTLKCPNCETELAISSTEEVKEYSFSEICQSDLSENWTDEVFSAQCKVCGAEIIADTYETVTHCLYCGSSHILEKRQTSGIRPEGVIPFKLDKSSAKDIFSKWNKKQWLAPNDFKHLCQQKELKGVYVPYWTYDSDVSSSYRGRGGKYYYVTRRVNNETVRERRTRWYNVNGHVHHTFDDVLVSASSNLKESVLSEIEPFTTQQAQPYQSDFLSGYLAEHYTLGVKDGFEVAKLKMEKDLKRKAHADILKRYDCADSITLTPTYRAVTYKHLLLPVWVMTYHYKDKHYQCLINGETGKIQGEAPRSIIKMSLLITLCVLLACWFLYDFFMFNM